MAVIDELIKKLKATGHCAATVLRHKHHVEVCEKLGVEPDSFIQFATEVINTLTNEDAEPVQAKAAVEDMLRIGPEVYPPYQPPVRFAQYETPRGEELVFGTNRRRR